MSAARETKNIWWYLFTISSYSGWRGKDLLTRRFWRYREYLWHDSFGKYFNRLTRCPLLGCRYKRVSDPGEVMRLHCFNCERDF